MALPPAAPCPACSSPNPWLPLCLQAAPQRVRSWGAHEEWLKLGDFSNQLHSLPFSALLGCDSWRVGGWAVPPAQLGS